MPTYAWLRAISSGFRAPDADATGCVPRCRAAVRRGHTTRRRVPQGTPGQGHPGCEGNLRDDLGRRREGHVRVRRRSDRGRAPRGVAPCRYTRNPQAPGASLHPRVTIDAWTSTGSSTACLDPDGLGQDFAYTDGLWRHGSPEFHIWARPPDGPDPGADWSWSDRDMMRLLNDAGLRQLSGVLELGDTWTIQVDHGLATVRVPVTDGGLAPISTPFNSTTAPRCGQSGTPRWPLSTLGG